KRVEDDPHFDRTKATYLLRTFVDLNPHAIGKKVEIMLGHFVDHVERQIGHRAKAMIVTRSGLHAVRYKQALDQQLRARALPGKAETLVLDFANEADEIREAFQPYYEATLLSEATDPNLVYDRERELYDFHLFTKVEVQAFAALWFGADEKDKRQHARFYAV